MKMRTAGLRAARGVEGMLAGRRFYEAAARQARWTEGTINIVGDGPARLAGLAAARLFEWLLGWPVAVRSVADFRNYCIPMLRPRSLMLAVAPSGEGEDIIEAVRSAQKRGASALVLSRDPESPLARMARAVFQLPGEEEAPPQITTAFLEQAAMIYIGLIASVIFSPGHPLAKAMDEFEQLPGHLEWAVTSLDEVIHSLVPRFKGPEQFLIAGAGLYHATALQAARLARLLGIPQVHATEFSDLWDDAAGKPWRGERVLLLSGSNCRMKKTAHALASRLKENRIPVFSVTDSNDVELVSRSEMAILLPILSEITAPLLHLAFLQWLMVEANR